MNSKTERAASVGNEVSVASRSSRNGTAKTWRGMAFCGNCGTQLDGGERFCTSCGHRLGAASAAPAAAAAPAAPVAAAAPVALPPLPTGVQYPQTDSAVPSMWDVANVARGVMRPTASSRSGVSAKVWVIVILAAIIVGFSGIHFPGSSFLPTGIYLVIFVVGTFPGLSLIFHGTVAKNQWGINLTRISCPKCGMPQPRFVLKPTDAYEAYWGGRTCLACGTKMDKWGRFRA